jgi:hypothetical protein
MAEAKPETPAPTTIHFLDIFFIESIFLADKLVTNRGQICSKQLRNAIKRQTI